MNFSNRKRYISIPESVCAYFHAISPSSFIFLVGLSAYLPSIDYPTNSSGRCTSSPQYGLEVNSTSKSQIGWFEGGSTTWSGIEINATQSTAKPYYGFRIQDTQYAYTYLDNDSKSLVTNVNNVDRLTINSSGYVGIGITDPKYGLQVNTTSKSQIGWFEGGSATWAGIEINATQSAAKPYYGFRIQDTQYAYTYLDNDSKSLVTNVNNVDRLKIDSNGQVTIGNPTSQPNSEYKLAVENGIVTDKIRVREDLSVNRIKVSTDPSQVADYVFEKNYKLMPLDQLEKEIQSQKSLPGIPSRDDVKSNGGVDVGEFQMKLLEKIEELTLYTIEQNKLLQKQQIEINELRAQVKGNM